MGLLPREGQELEECVGEFTQGGSPGGDARKTQEGDVRHEGCGPELGVGVHRDDGRSEIDTRSLQNAAFYVKEKDTRALALSHMEMILQYLGHDSDWIGSVKSPKVAWR